MLDTKEWRGVHGAYPLLSVEAVRLGYRVDGQTNVAVGNVSFQVWPGEKVMLLGPSGCGKSTLLKAVAGFLEPDGGVISFAGQQDLRPRPDRAVVFQEFDQLFPWRTVLDNVAYPLRATGRTEQEVVETAHRFVELTGLSHAVDRFPHQLSGGMKQRVAIARALALDPTMLLMDEPFGSLDAQTRARLQRELGEITRRTEVTVLFVTHSIQEALVLGDRVVVLGHAPSEVRDVLEVTGAAGDPDSKRFAWTRRQLRRLLAEEEEVDDAVFE
ncbi:MAG TPA: ABC transporter ATP-binding protein [Rubrobacter sp.]|nr:ABC transporter ATP-binding protein [Rubrobacter sp.]